VRTVGQVNIVVNGRPREVGSDQTVADLVEALGLTSRRVVVERNGEPVDRAQYGSLRLEAGDKLEIVKAVQGG